MSTIKISELPKFSVINANTSNTLFVGIDIPSAQTFQFSAGTLADGLFANTALIVGNNRIVYPSTTAQFSGVANNFLQVNFQNFANGIYSSADYVASTADSDNATRYIDMGIGNGQYNDPVNYSAFKAYDGYLYVYGPGQDSPQGNLILGTASSNAIIQFIVGGTMSPNIVGWMTKTGLKLNTQSYITFSDGTTQTTAAASNAYSQAAFALANTTVTNQAAINATQNTSITAAFTQSNSSYTQANTATTNAAAASSYANSAYAQANTATTNAAAASLYANSAFNTANNALANTTGTFSGNLTVTGNVITNYALRVNNASMPGNTQYIVVTGTATGNIGIPSNPGYTFHSAVDGGNRIVNEAYSNTASLYASFIGRRARGTAANPLPTQNGDIIVRFGGNSFGSTKFSQFSDSRIEYVATENHTDTAKGTKIRFMNTPDGSNSAVEIATFNSNNVTFTGEVNPAKGFIYTPRILNGAQTAITIDFASDSMIRATFSSTLTMSFTNYTYGKVVEVWLTNTAGNGQTVNLGALANNSTTGATSLTVASGRSAKLQYFSIDGDQANTFVAVTYG